MPTATEIELKSEEDAAQLVIATIDTIPAKIKDRAEYERYMAELATAKTRIGRIESFFLALRRPWLDAQQKNRETEKGMLAPLEDRYKKLKKVCEQWFMDDLAETRRKQDEANAKHDAKVRKAIEKGKDPATIAPPKTVETKAPATIKTAEGVSIGMKLDKHFKITGNGVTSRQLIDKLVVIYRDEDTQGIPDNCWILDHTRLLAMIKNGVNVAGVELIELPGNRLGK